VASSRSRRGMVGRIGVDLGDADLLDAVIAGNVGAIGALYDRYGAAALGLSSRIVRNPSQAEDVVQEVFLQLRHHAETLRDQRAALASWLLATVRRRAVDVLRRDQNGGPADWGDSNEAAAAAWSDRYSKVTPVQMRVALGELPSEQRDAIELALQVGEHETHGGGGAEKRGRIGPPMQATSAGASSQRAVRAQYQPESTTASSSTKASN